MSSSKSNWNDAQAQCGDKDGMNLASITSPELQAYIISLFPSDTGLANPVFIGGNDQNVEGNFEWIGGEPWQFSQPLKQTANDEDNDCMAYAANSPGGEEIFIILPF